MIRFFQLMLAVFFISSCAVEFSDFASEVDPSLLVQQSSLDSATREENENPRGRRIFKGSYNRGNICNISDDCYEICDDIFSDNSEVELCAELRQDTVEEIDEMIYVFESSLNYPALRRIEGDVFLEMMEISTRPWVNLTDNVTDGEAEALLAWIAAEKDVAVAVKKHDKTGNYNNDDFYAGFTKLMKEVSAGDGCTLLNNFYTENITGDLSFKEIAEDERNTDAKDILKDLRDYNSNNDPHPCVVEGL